MHSPGGVMQKSISRSLVLFLCLSLLPAQSYGQELTLRDRQQTVYQSLLETPNNLDLMFEYAQLSLQLEDLEPAIATLERMLILQPNLPRVQLELGSAYFRLGAYDVAQHYFNQAKQADDIPAEVLQQIAAFEEQITRRTAQHTFNGEVSAGITYASNANLGPDSANVLALGIPAQLNPQFVSQGDVGVRALATLTHTYAFSALNNDFWRTDATGFTLKYFEQDSGNIDVLSLSTGPQLSLDKDQFGVKIRPVVTVDHVRSDDRPLYYSYGGGVQLSDTLDGTSSIFGSVQGGYRDYTSGNSILDGTFVDATAGGSLFVTPNLRLSSAASVGREDAALSSFSNTELSVRVSLDHNYNSGLAFVDRNWLLSLSGEATYRFFDRANPSVSATTKRRDTDLRVGLSNTFFIQDGFFVRAGVDYLYRESTLPNFELTNFSATFSIGKSF